jgi:twitching motility protein PilT
LVLVTGITGSGKSTTLASMIDYINHNRTGHILTIEDPIEYLIRDRRSIVNQRELGLDTPSFSVALRQALRQDPDVILIGEMRDAETTRTALLAAETGHLVFSTLHTSDAAETINRILACFDPHEQMQIRLQLTGVLKAVVSQRLLMRADGKGIVPACEVMIANARIRDMIADPAKTRNIPQAIEEGVSSFEMQSFDQSLMGLLRQGLITMDEARAASSNPDDFILRTKGVSSDGGRKWQSFDGADSTDDGLELPEILSVQVQDRPVIKGENVSIDDDPDYKEE